MSARRPQRRRVCMVRTAHEPPMNHSATKNTSRFRRHLPAAPIRTRLPLHLSPHGAVVIPSFFSRDLDEVLMRGAVLIFSGVAAHSVPHVGDGKMLGPSRSLYCLKDPGTGIESYDGRLMVIHARESAGVVPVRGGSAARLAPTCTHLPPNSAGRAHHPPFRR